MSATASTRFYSFWSSEYHTGWKPVKLQSSLSGMWLSSPPVSLPCQPPLLRARRPPSPSRHQCRPEIGCQIPPSCPTPPPGMWRRNSSPAPPPQSPGTAHALAKAWWVYSQKPDTGHGTLAAPQLESHPHPAPKLCHQSAIIHILWRLWNMFYEIIIYVGFILNGLQAQPTHYDVVCPLRRDPEV